MKIKNEIWKYTRPVGLQNVDKKAKYNILGLSIKGNITLYFTFREKKRDE